MSLNEYLWLYEHNPEHQELLKTQWKDAITKGDVRCPCGRLHAVPMAYKCLYCGVYFCFTCAEEHFGKTLKQYHEDKQDAKDN